MVVVLVVTLKLTITGIHTDVLGLPDKIIHTGLELFSSYSSIKSHKVLKLTKIHTYTHTKTYTLTSTRTKSFKHTQIYRIVFFSDRHSLSHRHSGTFKIHSHITGIQLEFCYIRQIAS